VDSISGMEKQDDLSFSEGEDETKHTEDSDRIGGSRQNESSQTSRDETWVRRTRCLVFVVLAATAATVGVATFRLASAQQEKRFESEVCQAKRREDTVRKLRCPCTRILTMRDFATQVRVCFGRAPGRV
jgi:hypothetical protein